MISSVKVKVSACVDCETPIIGERLRCPACHDRHADRLLVGDEDVALPRDGADESLSDEDETLPRDRDLDWTDEPLSVRQAVIAWFVTLLIVAVAAVLFVTAGRSC